MSNAPPVAPAVEQSVTMRIVLPRELYDKVYDLDNSVGAGDVNDAVVSAISLGLSLGQTSYTIDKSGDAEIRRLLGGRVDGQPKLLDMLRRLVSLHIGGHRVELRPAVLEQIAWAAKSLGKPVEEVAPKMIADAVSEKFRA